MSQSLAKNYLHIVFSTKKRIPFIDDKIIHRLHAYLGGIIKKMECKCICIGGVEDHVHILCILSQKITLMKLMEVLKKESSRWIKEQGEAYDCFHWQRGYGAFSISQSHVQPLIKYIQNQKEHHQSNNYKQEYRRLLKKYHIEYDERYIWQ